METQDVKLEPSWKSRLSPEFEKPYMKGLREFIRKEIKAGKTIYPKGGDIFRAMDLTPFDRVKVVIIGQDPYHGPGQAHGLSFSVPDETPFPPSLLNIFKELESDLGVKRPTNGNLSPWAEQGVLLLNATLTVERKKAGAHQNKGWEEFTDQVIDKINKEKENVVFILWGSYAQRKGAIINESKHFVIKSPHPSPLSAHRGFFGSRPFSKTNKYLKSIGKDEIDWSVSE